jgi:hypothetical protein
MNTTTFLQQMFDDLNKSGQKILTSALEQFFATESTMIEQLSINSFGKDLS